MTPPGPDQPRPDGSSRAVRRAAADAGTAAVLLGVLVLLHGRLQDAGPGQFAGRWAGTVLTASLLLLPAVLAPAAARLLAHPRTRPLPPQAATTVITGVAAALCCLMAGTAVMLARVIEPRVIEPTEAIRPQPAQLLTLALSAAVVIATATAAVALYRARPFPGSSYPALEGSGTSRPDLLDDLATLAARALPGGTVARGLARFNRGLDSWAWSPRRQPPPAPVVNPPVINPPVIKQSAVIKQSVLTR